MRDVRVSTIHFALGPFAPCRTSRRKQHVVPGIKGPEHGVFREPCQKNGKKRETYPAPILPRKFHTLTNDTNASTLSEPSASAIWARLLMAVRPDPVPQPMAMNSNLPRGQRCTLTALVFDTICEICDLFLTWQKTKRSRSTMLSSS